MSLREELIEAGAESVYRSVGVDDPYVMEATLQDVVVILDAFLDLLTEHADEWGEAVVASGLAWHADEADILDYLAVLRA